MRKKWRKRRSAKRRHNTSATPSPPRSVQEYFAKPERFQDRWNRVTHVISRMRASGVSLRKASQEFGIAPRVVVNLAGSALRRRKTGRYVAKAKDRLLRVLTVPAPSGTREVALRDSEQASLLGQYWDAVQKYLQTGDAFGLEKFKRKRIVSADRKRIRLITDPEQLSRLGSAGVLSFESLYAQAGR